jgi:hypothetical protein
MSHAVSDSMPGCENPRILFSTMDLSSNRSWGFAAGATFTQRFRSSTNGVPHQLGVRMGANQDPYSARVQIYRNDQVILDRNYDNLRQRRSDWATIFDISGTSDVIVAGDWVQFSITPNASIGIEPIFTDDPDVPPGDLAGYGSMSARFYFCATLEPTVVEVKILETSVRTSLAASAKASADLQTVPTYPANYVIIFSRDGHSTRWRKANMDAQPGQPAADLHEGPLAAAGRSDRRVQRQHGRHHRPGSEHGAGGDVGVVVLVQARYVCVHARYRSRCRSRKRNRPARRRTRFGPGDGHCADGGDKLYGSVGRAQVAGPGQ